MLQISVTEMDCLLALAFSFCTMPYVLLCIGYLNLQICTNAIQQGDAFIRLEQTLTNSLQERYHCAKGTDQDQNISGQARMMVSKRCAAQERLQDKKGLVGCASLHST